MSLKSGKYGKVYISSKNHINLWYVVFYYPENLKKDWMI